MRTVLIIRGKDMQLDLVPENKADKHALSCMEEGATFRVVKASGYSPCRGGYLRPFESSDELGFTLLTTVEKRGDA